MAMCLLLQSDFQNSAILTFLKQNILSPIIAYQLCSFVSWTDRNLVLFLKKNKKKNNYNIKAF